MPGNEAQERKTVAQENLDLALANDPRTATPLEASEAFLASLAPKGGMVMA